jgi:hypothetical protein
VRRFVGTRIVLASLILKTFSLAKVWVAAANSVQHFNVDYEMDNRGANFWTRLPQLSFCFLQSGLQQVITLASQEYTYPEIMAIETSLVALVKGY